MVGLLKGHKVYSGTNVSDPRELAMQDCPKGMSKQANGAAELPGPRVFLACIMQPLWDLRSEMSKCKLGKE